MTRKLTILLFTFTTLIPVMMPSCKSTKEDPSLNPSDIETQVDQDPLLPPIELSGPIGGDRPVEVQLPDGYSTQTPGGHPLLLLLHGFNTDGQGQDTYLGVSEQALKRGFVFLAPNGTPTIGKGSLPFTTRFWNATESCCNFTNAPVDDVAYLRDLIRQVSARYNINRKKVYLLGHSNGGFMANRMACDQSSRITAIASLAGSLLPNPQDCKPKEPVSVLTIHGTKDLVIKYEGGRTLSSTPDYPSAMSTIKRWADINGCSSTVVSGEPVTLLEGSNDLETQVFTWQSCTKNMSTIHWQLGGASHVPDFNSAFMPKVLDFFESQVK